MKGTVNVLLNFRKNSSLSAKIIGVLEPNETVEVIEDCGEWLKIKHEKKSGYVMAEYIDLDDEPSQEPAENPDDEPSQEPEKKTEEVDGKRTAAE